MVTLGSDQYTTHRSLYFNNAYRICLHTPRLNIFFLILIKQLLHNIYISRSASMPLLTTTSLKRYWTEESRSVNQTHWIPPLKQLKYSSMYSLPLVISDFYFWKWWNLEVTKQIVIIVRKSNWVSRLSE